jgi:hypothetical protein
MATYKVIQDIEAEDKILGPLTLKQFIYALITGFFGYICFLCVSSGVAFLLVLFAPPTLIAGFFAVPFGKDQPTEVWALAKLRFYFKPRKRTWDQSGVKEVVTINVPKKIERILTKSFSQSEVQSRLAVLAKTIDSRGWATKNSNLNIATRDNANHDNQSDRLVKASSMTQDVPDIEVRASDDILDASNNPIAQQFDTMINDSAKNRRQQLIDKMNSITAVPALVAATPQQTAIPNDYWFLHQSTPGTAIANPQPTIESYDSRLVQPGANNPGVPDEAALVEQFKASNSAQSISYAHMRTIQPLGSAPAHPAPPMPQAQTQAPREQQQAARPAPAAPIQQQPSQAPQQTQAPRAMISPMPARAPQSNPAPAAQQQRQAPQIPTAPAQPSAPRFDPAILSLAKNNDLNVATLAREAHKALDPSEDEVVITLH